MVIKLAKETKEEYDLREVRSEIWLINLDADIYSIH